ncbi:MAG: hypothetical protein JRI68_06060 [Deltaproteobacteria bacterium]|nr:hypothetical protein [Deltaproteobacteria bacterium]
MDLGERAESLAAELLAPLVLGGPLALQRPFGARLALELGVQRTIVDNDLRTRIDSARLREARTLVAVDVLPPLGLSEWAIAAALNDLLQITNHELSSFATRTRHQELLDATVTLCRTIPACASLQEAVARHGTFSRALAIRRTDVEVKWWTGSSSFRGQQPPSRLLAWPGLRKVNVTQAAVGLAEMTDGIPIAPAAFDQALSTWCSLSPLSDLASTARPAPQFAWTAHTLSIVGSPAGCNLALRAFDHATHLDDAAVAAAVTAMNVSAGQLPAGSHAQALAVGFTKQLAAMDAYWDRAAGA